MFEVTIHIPGLLELAEALKQMCGGKGQEPAEAASIYGNPVVPTATQPAVASAVSVTPQPAPAPAAQVSASQSMASAPQSVPDTLVTPQMVQPPVTSQAVPVQAAVPTSAPAYALDDLARAAMTLMDSGRQPDLQKLLSDFGVEALPALPPERYGAFATALRGMGAQI